MNSEIKFILFVFVFGLFCMAVTTTYYTEENGFTKSYVGQTYVDLDNMKICHNEDCSE